VDFRHTAIQLCCLHDMLLTLEAMSDILLICHASQHDTTCHMNSFSFDHQLKGHLL